MRIEMVWDIAFSPKLVATKTTVLENSLKAGFREPLLASIPLLSDAIDDNFATAGHGRWAPLSAKTIAKKKRNNDKILIESGKLRRSASAKARWNVRSDAASFDNLPGSVEYGYLHITGTRKMPVRDWLGVDGEVVDEIGIKIFNPWLARKIEAAGL